jgi:glycerol-3-phosphate dehydrogenase
MTRDLRRMADTRFDLVIIGAGFYGAIAAWDATLRGLSVALIDKGDFGSGTSFNNLKTLHGGLRSLQSFDLAQVRLFVRERRALARVAPHLVRPLPFIVPTYRDPRRSAAAMRLALGINDVLSHDRHHDLPDQSLRLPNGELVSREECLRLNQVVDPAGVTGGAVWYDYQVHSTDRMTFSFVQSAADGGAATANYVRATALLRDDDRIAGVRVEDELSSDRFDIRAGAVLNAAGPWASALLEEMIPGVLSPAPLLSRALNLITRRGVGTHACGGLVGGRFLFLVPWRDVSILGTSHDPHAGSPDTLAVTRDMVAAFLDEGRKAFPSANLSPDDITLVHRGLLPMTAGDGPHVRLLRESAVVDHAGDGAPGLVSMFGVRYTTARHTAARAIDAVFRNRGVSRVPPSGTAETPVVGGAIADKEAFVRDTLRQQTRHLSQAALRRLAHTYGTQFDKVAGMIRQQPALGRPLSDRCPITVGEIVYAAREESAVRLADALIRRTEAGSAGHPGKDALASAAGVMARELGWDSERVRDEVAAVEAFYHVPG